MSGSGSGERRAFYRLRYPETDRPVLLFDNMTFDVVEISESGSRIYLNHSEIGAGTAFVGWIRFFDGYATPVEGVVLRIEGPEAVIQLSVGVSLKRMLDEQRRLIQLYPILYERSEGEPI